jgi:hypothetical protein
MRYFRLLRQIGRQLRSLGKYAVISGNSLPKFRDNLLVTLADETDKMSLNVGKELPLIAA